MMRSLLVLAVLVPASAFADPFEVVDRGDSLEVIAHGMTAAKLEVVPVRSRLEIPLVGAPVAERLVPSDKPIRQIELDGNETRSLSVKLAFDRDEVRTIASSARVSQVGDDLHLTFPKSPAAPVAPVATAVAPVAPAPPAVETAPAAPPAGPATAAPPATPAIQPAAAAAVVEPAPSTPSPRALSSAAGEPASGSAATPTPSDASHGAASRGLLKPRRESGTRLPTLIAVVVAGLGATVWMLRRKKNPSLATNGIEVLAQRMVGKNARIVWLSAGQRELIVAVTPQQVRLLGQWNLENGAPPPATLVRDELGGQREPAAPSGPLPRAASTPAAPALGGALRASPTIAGLLRLREKVPALASALPPVSEEVATDDVDADLVWARELLAATGQRR